jgi:DNA modification methylase
MNLRTPTNPTLDPDEALALADLTPDPRNTRRHTARNLAQIEQALTEVGAARSIVVDEAGTILAGNATVQAAKQIGIERLRIIETDGTELVAVRRPGLTPEQKARLALLDNRSAELAEWDEEVLAAIAQDIDLSDLWEADELAELLGQPESLTEALVDPDLVPEPPEEPTTQPGDLWLLGEHRLLCGDSTDPAAVRLLMNGKRSPLMPTDPPYLVNYQGGNHPQSWHNKAEVKDKHWDDYQEGDGAEFFSQFLAAALAEALTANPAIYQFHASSRQVLVEQAWRENGLLVHQQLIWMKSRAVLTHSHYMWQHEPCFYGWVQGKPPAKKPPANATTVWPIDQAGDSSGLHPTQKPVELIERMISYNTSKGEVVYEPFAGSGTCLIAAELTGRRCFALELSPAFCDVIVQRWEGVTGKTAERVPAPSSEPPEQTS